MSIRTSVYKSSAIVSRSGRFSTSHLMNTKVSLGSDNTAIVKLTSNIKGGLKVASTSDSASFTKCV